MDFQENKLKTNIQIIVTLNKKVFMHIWIKKKERQTDQQDSSTDKDACYQAW